MKRLLDDADETLGFQPRGLSGGTERPGPTWRATRLEAEDKATLTKALVEEIRGAGWRYRVNRGVVGVIAEGERLSKERALAAATRAMERAGPSS